MLSCGIFLQVYPPGSALIYAYCLPLGAEDLAAQPNPCVVGLERLYRGEGVLGSGLRACGLERGSKARNSEGLIPRAQSRRPYSR